MEWISTNDTLKTLERQLASVQRGVLGLEKQYDRVVEENHRLTEELKLAKEEIVHLKEALNGR